MVIKFLLEKIMLKNIKYNDVCQKFHRGINRINNEEVIDVAITSFAVLQMLSKMV